MHLVDTEVSDWSDDLSFASVVKTMNTQLVQHPIARTMMKASLTNCHMYN